MNRRRLTGFYAVVVGTAMLGMWSGLLVTDAVPELRTAPVEISYHLVAEFATAIALLGGGLGLLRNWRWAGSVTFVALGMLLYTVLNSAGYYAQLEDRMMVSLFAVLTVTTLTVLWLNRAGFDGGVRVQRLGTLGGPTTVARERVEQREQ